MKNIKYTLSATRPDGTVFTQVKRLGKPTYTKCLAYIYADGVVAFTDMMNVDADEAKKLGDARLWMNRVQSGEFLKRNHDQAHYKAEYDRCVGAVVVLGKMEASASDRMEMAKEEVALAEKGLQEHPSWSRKELLNAQRRADRVRRIVAYA